MAPPLSTTNSWDLLALKWPSECIWVFDAAVDSIHLSSKDSPISLDPQHHFQSFGRSHVAQVQDLAWMASGLDLLYEAWGGLQSRFIFTCYQRLSGIRCCNSGFPASMIYCQKMNIFECRAKFWGKPSQPHAQFYSSPFPPSCRHMSAKCTSQSMPDCLPKVAHEHLVETKLFSKQLSTTVIRTCRRIATKASKIAIPYWLHQKSYQHVQCTESHSASQNSTPVVLIVSSHENSWLRSCCSCIRLLLLEGFLQGPQHIRRDQIKWA